MELTKLSKLITKQVERNPNNIAIEHNGSKVSYKELECYSNKIANFLYSNYTAEKNVILFMDSCPILIEAIVGVIKSGGIFTPVDVNYPLNRVGIMIEETAAEWVITNSMWLEKLNEIMKAIDKKVKVIVFEGCTDNYSNLEVYDFNNLDIDEKIAFIEEENKNCYLYFTSGSTGKPKGILGRNKSLSHFIQWEKEEFKVSEGDRFSQITSPSFDPFLREIFVPLISGGTLCIPDTRDIIFNPLEMKAWLIKERINYLHMVPSLFKIIMGVVKDKECFQDMKYVILAGEVLRGADVKKFIDFFEDRINLINMYGPTETTLAKFYHKVVKEDCERLNVPVGKPISYTQALILNENMKVCEAGNVGEVYIRTPFITSGYYKNKELTKKVFLRNPFSENSQDIIYKTGDLGKMLQNGEIELLGRKDHQLKIRGNRVELGEIENKLKIHNLINDAIVVAQEDENSEKYICAYYIGEKLNVSELREFLMEYLPQYMIPSYFVKIDNIPLLPNGKLNYASLPKPDKEKELSVEYIAPVNKLQSELAQIWSEILGKDKIGIKNNFFEVGGDSLKLIKMNTVLEERFPGKVKIIDIFNNPSIEKLAKLIDKSSVNEKTIEKIEGIILPEECFEHFFDDENTNMSFDVSKDIIDIISKNNSVDRVDVILAVYIYIFNELSESNDICLQVISEKLNETDQINVNLKSIGDFTELFELVKDIRSKNNSKYSLDNINNIDRVKEKNTVVPLVYQKGLINSNITLTNYFDIILEFDVKEKDISFTCNFNNYKLNSRSIEELINRYYSILSYIGEQYKELG